MEIKRFSVRDCPKDSFGEVDTGPVNNALSSMNLKPAPTPKRLNYLKYILIKFKIG
jgi:hypothetical protein